MLRLIMLRWPIHAEKCGETRCLTCQPAMMAAAQVFSFCSTPYPSVSRHQTSCFLLWPHYAWLSLISSSFHHRQAICSWARIRTTNILVLQILPQHSLWDISRWYNCDGCRCAECSRGELAKSVWETLLVAEATATFASYPNTVIENISIISL